MAPAAVSDSATIPARMTGWNTARWGRRRRTRVTSSLSWFAQKARHFLLEIARLRLGWGGAFRRHGFDIDGGGDALGFGDHLLRHRPAKGCFETLRHLGEALIGGRIWRRDSGCGGRCRRRGARLLNLSPLATLAVLR